MVGAATRMRAEEEYPEIIANVVIRSLRAEGPATVHPVLGDSDGARPSRHVVPLGGDRAGRMPLEQRAKMDALRHLAEDGRQEVIDQHSRYRIPPSAMPMCVSLRRQYFTGHNAGMAQFTDQDTAGVVQARVVYVGVALSQRVTDAFLRTGRRWSVACGFAVGLVALLLDPDGKQNEQAASVLTGHERPQPGLSVSQALSDVTQGTARASCRHGSGSTARAARG
jgi:hypothetical protein